MATETANIVNQAYWDNSYGNYNFAVAGQDDPLTQFIVKYIGKTSNFETCLEFGCFPGRYLAVLGGLGYTLNGIDLTPRTETDLKVWLEECGYQVQEIACVGLEQWDSRRKYDLVCSFGFIEHFTNFEDIIQSHLNHVASSGRILITTPNFAGFFQRLFHQLADGENLARHYLPSMNPQKWAKILKKEGFEIEFCGYFGSFDFWVDHQKRTKLQMKLLSFIHKWKPFFKKLPEGNRLYSPYCGIVAKKIT